MKKNKIMRIASVLMVAVLLSTCAISGTFAKYTTQDSASDSARVAKWGVELQVVGNLYGDTYKNDIVAEDSAIRTVQSVDKNADVVAPGTKNESGFAFSLNGKPEVDGTITSEMKIQNVFLKAGTYGLMLPVTAVPITAGNFDEFDDDLYKCESGAFIKVTEYDSLIDTYYTLEDVVTTADYYPVVYTLTGISGDTSSTGTIDADSLKAAAEAIALALDMSIDHTDTDTSITYKGTKTFTANTDLATLKLRSEKLTWEWVYGNDTKVGDTADVTDMADTILGLLKNATGTVVKLDTSTSPNKYKAPIENTDYCLNTQFSIDITVTQND